MTEDLTNRRLIDRIVGAFREAASSSGRKVPKNAVLAWMQATDPQVQGCVFSMISNQENISHIAPPLQFDEVFPFAIAYLEQCIQEDYDLEWVESRYLAGHALVGLITNLWNDRPNSHSQLTEVKERLTSLYKQGDSGVRDAVLNGVLEHLFEVDGLTTFFKDWKDDPTLAVAYEGALGWKKEGSF
jgi:hypothetical protein